MAKRHDLRIKEFDGEHILERTMSFGGRGALVGEYNIIYHGGVVASTANRRPRIGQNLLLFKLANH